ncbi:glycoside hydrolase superfamily [Cokeromyces recurvatus]|uniref:glycoside hydrolase superfamily n=1 Tax=Cokeromyces recurvatus TaxID=90255 RepID=UPI00221F432B|nr:glycoside hydrolase superfamily [Cokeromyces recurvatus]KAI7903163.1 glycoside hydrolase superfamily [Cokeromyces recurvatus]
MGNSCKVFIRSFSIIIIALLLSVKASPISHIKHHNGTVYNYWTTKAWGANLGNWLILEKWMDSSIFDKYAPKAVDEWTFCQHATNPAKALEEHWNSWVREDDFKILASVHANHVRIPVGYWAFITPDSGEPYVSSGQKKQIERILQYCNTYNMYAIIDLHGLPGSQNGEAHSGHIGPIQFYSDYNIERSIKTIRAIVDWMNGLDYVLKSRIASIQSANEPRIVKDNQLNILKKYYNDAFHIIDASPYKVPMIFHDAFQGLSAWNDFLPVPANAVIDLHSYFAFPPISDTKSIISSICSIESPAQHFHLPVLFGEWSLASGVPNSDSWLKEMMDTQVAIYKTGGAGGTFWALKNNINSSVWSFEQLVNEGIINATTYLYHTNAQC